MRVFLDFYRHVKTSAGNTYISSLVIDARNFGISVGEVQTQITNQRVSAGILVFRLRRFLVFIFVPIWAPIIGVVRTDLICNRVQSIQHESREVAGIGRRAAVQGLADLFDGGVTIAGVAANDALDGLPLG